MRSSVASLVFASIVGVASAGCAAAPSKGPTDVAMVPIGLTETTNAEIPHPTDQLVNVGSNVRVACGVDNADAPPKFDYDESKLASNDRNVLRVLATCFTTGPLKGRAVAIISRADAAANDPSAMSAEQGARQIRLYLEGLGVEPRRMRTTPPMPDNDGGQTSLRPDRRVDVELAD